jgi:Fe-S cluster biogenesis protein NfuA
MLSHEMLVAQICDVLEELRPQFLMHGGNIKFVSFVDGIVNVKLSGACDGCPSSMYTLKLLIENTLKKEVPQVISVEEVFE